MDELAKVIRHQLGLRLSGVQLEALSVYERELIDWNLRYNLTAITNQQEIRIKHFLDSFTCMLAMRDTPLDRVIDIGTGAGFPGLPLKIIYPSMYLTLADSVGKKVDFCRHMVNRLSLERVEIIQERAEALGQMTGYREKYDWALARAVAILPVLSEYLLPLVRVGGRVLAMKGESGPAEAHAAEHSLRLLGGHLRQLIPVTLPGVVEERYLVIIDKVAATPNGYPRRVGIPSKHPLKG
jgi:16S rRNA (guanine527-N7)-methyltransferase